MVRQASKLKKNIGQIEKGTTHCFIETRNIINYIGKQFYLILHVIRSEKVVKTFIDFMNRDLYHVYFIFLVRFKILK